MVYVANPCIFPNSLSHIHVARRLAAVLYRGVVASLSPGWQASALPLTAANDDPTPPFPLSTALGGLETDALPTAAPLVLYRVLLKGTLDAGNLLRAVKSGASPGQVELRY